MAKKRRRRKTSLLTKAINIGVILIGLSRPIALFMNRPPQSAMNAIVEEASFGMVRQGKKGSFDLQRGMNMYGPIVGAVVLKKAISLLRRTARV